MKRPVSLYALFLFHLPLTFCALVGGIMMVIKPDGSLLGLEISRLKYTPFPNYLLIGILLFFFSGVFPLFTLVGLVIKPFWKSAGVFNMYNNMHWAWTYSLYAGIISILWITVQMFFTAYLWMYPVVILLGLLVIIFTLVPANIRYFKMVVGEY
jgi:hypothetical protein